MRATDTEFLALLRRYLGEFIVDEVSHDVLFSVDCGTGRLLPGGKMVHPKYRLYVSGLKIYDGRSREELAGRLISGIRDIATRNSNEFVRIRAGGVVMDGGGLLLPSPPSAHLPALVARLVRDGAGYLGDEIVNIDPVLRRAHGASLPLLLDSRDLALFPELVRDAAPGRLRRIEALGAKAPRLPVRLDELGGTAAPPAPPRWIAFPSFELGQPTSLRPIGRAESLFRFTQAALNLHIWGERALLLMRELVETTRVDRLVVGAPAEAADLLATRWEADRG